MTTNFTDNALFNCGLTSCYLSASEMQDIDDARRAAQVKYNDAKESQLSDALKFIAKDGGEFSAADIAQITGLTPSAVSAVLNYLVRYAYTELPSNPSDKESRKRMSAMQASVSGRLAKTFKAYKNIGSETEVWARLDNDHNVIASSIVARTKRVIRYSISFR